MKAFRPNTLNFYVNFIYVSTTCTQIPPSFSTWRQVIYMFLLHIPKYLHLSPLDVKLITTTSDWLLSWLIPCRRTFLKYNLATLLSANGLFGRLIWPQIVFGSRGSGPDGRPFYICFIFFLFFFSILKQFLSYYFSLPLFSLYFSFSYWQHSGFCM